MISKNIFYENALKSPLLHKKFVLGHILYSKIVYLVIESTITVFLRKVESHLKTVIHFTQTAVDGRRIDNTVHMLRDFVQLANTEN